MRKAHIHRYAPHPEGGVRCTFEGCKSFENDGQNTGLGQIRTGPLGRWEDYARDTELKALAWAAGNPDRRAVDWITREVLT